MILSTLYKSLEQLSDSRIRAILVKSIALTILILFLLVSGLTWLLTSITLLDVAILDRLIDWTGILLAIVLAIIMLPAAVSGVASLFSDDVVDAVEARHYPLAPTARSQGWGEAIGSALGFGAILVVVNIAALPLYLVPGINLLVYYGINGYLLGREFSELVLTRYHGRDQGRHLRHKYRTRIMIAGVMIAFLLTIPVLNLLAPVVAAAFMRHVLDEATSALN